MMGGLAYMTGLPDRPLRAGSSVIDIMGGTFAAVGILAALREREKTGRGKRVTSALFESTAYLVAQHMAQYELTGEAPPPMSVKRPAWGIYDIFDTAGRRAAVRRRGDRHAMGGVLPRVRRAGPRQRIQRLKTNGMRVKERCWLLPRVNEITKQHTQASSRQARGHRHAVRADRQAVGPARRPAPQGLGRAAGNRHQWERRSHVPALPLELDGKRLGKRSDPPRNRRARRGIARRSWAVHHRKSKACASGV